MLKLRRFAIFRSFSSFKINIDKESVVKELNVKELKYPTKVPQKPYVSDWDKKKREDSEKIKIDAQTIQLLERLSLVDLDSKEALKTLEDSIEFASRILDINTDNVEPLYTVLENQKLLLREDQITDGNIQADILKNAKITEEEYFVAPPGNIPLEQEKNDEKNQNAPTNHRNNTK